MIDNQPTPESLAALVETVQEAMAAAAVAPGADWRGGLGISGIDFEEHIPGQVQAVHQVLGLPAERLTVVNDGIVALWGASPAARAGIIQHGSFMTSAIRSEPGQERIYDNLDVAAAVDLRREAVRLVARMIDGPHASHAAQGTPARTVAGAERSQVRGDDLSWNDPRAAAVEVVADAL